MNIKLIISGLVGVGLLAISTGCTSIITRGTPVASTSIQANMNTGNCEVLARTKGTSSLTSVLGGTVEVIDGDKYRILGIKFFQDQYAFYDKPSALLGLFGNISVEDRAFYKALAATPDADAIAAKAWVITEEGVPFFWQKKEVTFQGKALKFSGGN